MATFWVKDGLLKARDLVPGSLEDSLAKWEYLFNLCVAGEMVHDGSCNTCSLCLKYLFGAQAGDCTGCPIHEYTALFDCRGTPYENYHRAVECGDLPAATSAADAMMLFLEKLLFESL